MRIPLRFLPGGAGLLLGASLAAAASGTAFVRPDVHGNTRLRYSVDKMTGMENHQGAIYLALDGRNVFWEKLAFSLDARERLNYEKNGDDIKKRSSFNPYLANASANDLFGMLSLKAGRQYYYAGETTAHFDGGAAELQPLKWLKMAAYGGKPVDTMGQSLAAQYQGAALKLGSGRQGYVRFDLLLASHRREYATDREAQVTVFRRLLPGLDFTGNLSYLDRLPKSVSARVLYYMPKWGLTLTPNYYKHLLLGDPASLALSPYRRAAVYTDRFERVGLGASKYFDIGLSLSGGVNYSQPSKRKDGYLNATMPNLFLKKIEAVVSGSYDTQTTRRTWLVTASTTYPFTKSLKVSAGGSYNQTRDTAWSGSGNMDSRTWFGTAKWILRKGLDFSLSPSMVKSSGIGAPIYRVELTNNWRF